MIFSTPAYAQATSGGASAFGSFIPLILIFIIMYFLLIRPQQKKLKNHKAMVKSIRRGDQVVTAGGIIGKVTKVKEDEEISVQISKDVTVQVIKSTISHVTSKTDPAG